MLFLLISLFIHNILAKIKYNLFPSTSVFCVPTDFDNFKSNGFGLTRVSCSKAGICEVLTAPSADTDMLVSVMSGEGGS